MCRKSKALLPAVVALAALWGGGLHAQDEDWRDAMFRERWADHLPEYCLYTHRLPDWVSGWGKYLHPYSKGKYTRQFGETWMHMHHYCMGMEKMYLATSENDERRRRGYFEDAVKEFDYVLGNAHEGYVLLPEILTKKGTALVSLGKYGEAANAYVEAVQADADYAPAYIGLSSCFESLGDPTQALAVVDQALTRIPSSEALLARRSELTAHASARVPKDE